MMMLVVVVVVVVMVMVMVKVMVMVMMVMVMMVMLMVMVMVMVVVMVNTLVNGRFAREIAATTSGITTARPSKMLERCFFQRLGNGPVTQWAS